MPNKSVMYQVYDEHIWVKHGICLINPKCSKHPTNQASDELGPLGTWPYKFPGGVTDISSSRFNKQEFLGIQFTKIKALRIKTRSRS